MFLLALCFVCQDLPPIPADPYSDQLPRYVLQIAKVDTENVYVYDANGIWDDNLRPLKIIDQYPRGGIMSPCVVWRPMSGCPPVGPVHYVKADIQCISPGEDAISSSLWHIPWIFMVAVQLPDDAALAVAEAEFLAEINPSDSPHADLIAQLGWPCYHCRERASRDIRDMGVGGLPLLVWARRSRDPEIKARAERLWDAVMYQWLQED